MSKFQSWNTITMFCLLIFGFTVATLVKPNEEYSETENRTLAQMPKASISSILDGSFESDYETYLTDQFVGRDGWIGMKTAVERFLQKKESKDIYFAKDDYLIEKHTGAFTTDTAEQNIHVLNQFIQKYQKLFSEEHMTVMVVPNAVEILEDMLPSFASPYDQSEYLQKIENVLPEGIWFDTADILREHSSEEIYYRTDHHWTTRAAFYIYQAWAKAQGFEIPTEDNYVITAVSDEFAGTIQSKLGIETRLDTIETFRQKDDIFYTVQKNGSSEMEYTLYDNLALDTKNKYDIFFGGNQARVTIRTRNENGRRILVVKDSYAHCFVPFLLDEFAEIEMIDIRYYNQKISELIDNGTYTDLLFLYNASGFAEDTSISRLLY